jgi:thiamine pyrophosphate-dependent acetolactate synthase large subunit-like protein
MNLACKTAITEREVAHLIFPDDDVFQQAVDRVTAANRPIIIVGYGARHAMDPTVCLAEQLNTPVLTTFKAKGQIVDDHPLAAGVLGRSRTPVASWFMCECDLILACGASFSNHAGIAPKKPIAQIDFVRSARVSGQCGKRVYIIRVSPRTRNCAALTAFVPRSPKNCGRRSMQR